MKHTNIQVYIIYIEYNRRSFEMSKVAIYIRVSTKEQAVEGYSIEEQEKLGREYCKDNNHEVFKVYSDKGISGKNITGRPGIRALMADAEKGLFDILLVWKVNRLSRKLYDTLDITNRLGEFNIELRSLTESLDTLTATGRLMMNIFGSFAEFEREQIAENVKMGMEARAEEGRWNGGIVLGYDLQGDDDKTTKRPNKRLVINDVEAETVRYIFELYSKGNGYKAICNKINKEGYKSKKGNFFSVCTVREILKNPLYCGKIRYNQRVKWKHKHRNGMNVGPMIVEGVHEAIITEELFNKVQYLIEAKGGKSKRTFDGTFPLTGLLRCPECGSGMVAGRVTRNRKDGTKFINRYYYCGAWRNKGTGVCHSNGIRADDVEKHVFSKIDKLIISEAFLKMVLKRANEKRKDCILPAENKAYQLEEKIKILEDNRDNYLKLMESKVMKAEDLIPKLKDIGEKLTILEEELKKQERFQDQDSFEEIPYDLIKKTLENFEELLNKSSGNEERKTLLNLMIDEINIGKNKRVEEIIIKFNKELMEYALGIGGLPNEGNPFTMYKNRIDLRFYDIKVII